MPDQGGLRAEAELGAALVALADRIDFPEELNLASAVGSRLRQERRSERGRVVQFRPRSTIRPVFRPAWQRIAVTVAAALVVLAGTLVASPGARQAVANFLGLRGVRIKVGQTPPPVPTPSLGYGLSLGEPVTLAEARARVSFRIRVANQLGPPDETYVLETFSGSHVSLLYRERPGLPRASTTGVGLLLTEFQARIDQPLLGKAVGQGAVIQGVTVNGHPGFWIGGEPHELYFLDPSGQVVPDTVRLAGNSLLWQDGSVVIRIESALTLDQALNIAQSVK